MSLIRKSNTESCEFRPLSLRQQFRRLERRHADKLTNRKCFPCASAWGPRRASRACLCLACTQSRFAAPSQIPPFGIPTAALAASGGTVYAGVRRKKQAPTRSLPARWSLLLGATGSNRFADQPDASRSDKLQRLLARVKAAALRAALRGNRKD